MDSKSDFNLKELVSERRKEQAKLNSQYVNPKMVTVLKTIGFDRTYVRGEGSYLWDENGTKYLDFISGFGMFNMGRNHPVIKKAITDYLELDDTWKLSMGINALPGLLAEALLKRVPHLDKVYFASSGTDCVEAALKFARNTTGKEGIAYCEGAFHGLTYGSLSINGSKHFRDGFLSLLDGPVKVPFNDLEALEKMFSQQALAGVIVEPVQGKSLQTATDEYLQGVQDLCRKHKALFIVDEIQTGMGRTGKLFAFQHVPGLEPDMVLVSKSLSGGMVPVGAVLMSDKIYNGVYSSLDKCMVHSSTFGGGGLPMACGLASLHVLESENLIENAGQQGDYIINSLKAMIPEFEMLKAVHGQGLIIGIEFGKPKSFGIRSAWNMIHALDKGLFPQAVSMPLLDKHHILTQVAGHNVDIVKLLPTLNITKEDADWFLDAFRDTMKELHRFGGPIVTTAKHLAPFAMGKKQKV